MEVKEVDYTRKSKLSFASAVVNSSLPFMPGIYLVFDFNNDKLGKILYVGKSGTDKNGKIICHQLPERLLAVCYPKKNIENCLI